MVSSKRRLQAGEQLHSGIEVRRPKLLARTGVAGKKSRVDEKADSVSAAGKMKTGGEEEGRKPDSLLSC
jgi:hypothetical protein